MAEDIEEVKKIIAEKNLKTIPDVQKAVEEEVKKLPEFFENEKKVIQARGSILELSTLVENVFDEIIVLTNEKNNLPKWRFRTKAKFIEKVMREIDPIQKHFNEAFLKKFEDFVDLRNIFAHVPTDKFSGELKFTNALRYNNFFQRNGAWRDLKLSVKDAISAGYEILPSITKLIIISQERAKLMQDLMELFNKKEDFEETN
jgi:hypothetical protein